MTLSGRVFVQLSDLNLFESSQSRKQRKKWADASKTRCRVISLGHLWPKDTICSFTWPFSKKLAAAHRAFWLPATLGLWPLAQSLQSFISSIHCRVKPYIGHLIQSLRRTRTCLSPIEWAIHRTRCILLLSFPFPIKTHSFASLLYWYFSVEHTVWSQWSADRHLLPRTSEWQSESYCLINWLFNKFYSQRQTRFSSTTVPSYEVAPLLVKRRNMVIH